MGSIFNGFMCLTNKAAVPLTIGGAMLLPFFGAIMDRVHILNPEAGVLDYIKGWFSPLITDPNSVLAVEPEMLVNSADLLTGAPGVLAGIGSAFDGWGHFFSAAWDASAPFIDVATGGAGTLVSAFNAVSTVSECTNTLGLECI